MTARGSGGALIATPAGSGAKPQPLFCFCVYLCMKFTLISMQYIYVTRYPVQQQKGSKDCGLFAVAFATELCSEEDPTRAVFKQCSMRQHLYNCLEAGEISRFPQYTKKELRSLPKNTAKHSTLKTFDQELFCLCRLPECYDKRMVQCTACKSWYHFQCVGFKSKNEVPKSWKCNSCISE